MLEKLSRVGGATIVGLGLFAAVAESAAAPMPYTADFQLTTTVLAMGGLGYETIEPDLIARVLNGYFADEENLVGVPWPGQMAPWNGTLTLAESVAVGLENMNEAIRNAPGTKIVAGASGTTLVVDEVMRSLANDPNAPAAEEISFVVMGDANRGVFKQLRGVTLPIFDYTVPELPVTKYDVLVVAGEYDGIGDWPDRSWNLLADFNALAGTGLLQQVVPENIVNALALESYGSVHYDAMFADLAQVPAENVTVSVNALGGVTTTYLVPTADLPMLRPLKTLGVPQVVVDALTCVLRPIIDSAYVRNDPPWPRLVTSRTDRPVGTAKPTASLQPTTRPAAARLATDARPSATRSTGRGSGSPTTGVGKAAKRATASRSAG